MYDTRIIVLLNICVDNCYEIAANFYKIAEKWYKIADKSKSYVIVNTCLNLTKY